MKRYTVIYRTTRVMMVEAATIEDAERLARTYERKDEELHSIVPEVGPREPAPVKAVA